MREAFQCLALHRILPAGHILHLGHRVRIFPSRRVDLLLQPVIRLQHGDPFGHGEGDLLHLEFIEDALQNLADGGPIQIQAADRNHRMAVFLLHLLGQLIHIRLMGIHTVEQNHKGFVDFIQLSNNLSLRRPVFFPGNVADGAVGGNDQPDGGMLPDHLAGAGLGRLIKGDLLLKPGAFHHAGLFVLLVAHGSFYHIAHTVDEPGLEAAAALQLDGNSGLRNEFRLGGHDGAPRGGLGQFVPRPVLHRRAGELRQHQLLHEFFDEGTFAGTHRPHHTNVNIAAGAGRDVLVYALGFHWIPPPPFTCWTVPAAGPPG